jgi:hypothetical protein
VHKDPAAGDLLWEEAQHQVNEVNHPRTTREVRVASIERLAGRWNEEAKVASYEGYCVKCREKRTFEGQEVELANGRRAAQGTCPVCGTKMNRILGKK